MCKDCEVLADKNSRTSQYAASSFSITANYLKLRAKKALPFVYQKHITYVYFLLHLLPCYLSNAFMTLHVLS